jgi:CRISPR system Cascade subunit CasE
LLAEVVVAKKSDGRSRGKRVDPVLEARIANPSRPYAQLAREHGTKWLQRRAEAFGFDIAELERCDYEVMEFVREGQPIRLSTINFAGRLRVTDPERFRAALLQGVGHGKAWGCGLLLCMKR